LEVTTAREPHPNGWGFFVFYWAIRYRIKLNVIFLARRGLGSELKIPDYAASDQKAGSPDRFIFRL
jgi:hypothetical protein